MLSPSLIAAVAERDLRRRLRDPLMLLVWSAIPLAVAILMRLAFGTGDEGIPRAKVAFVDHDRTIGSELVRTAFARGPAADMFSLTELDSTAAAATLHRGEVSAVVVVPKGFARDLADGRTTRLRLYRNPSERVLPSIVEETLSMLADGVFYLRAILDRPLRRIVDSARADDSPGTAKSGPGDLEVSEIATEVNQAIRAVQAYVFPPVLKLSVEQRMTGGVRASYFLLLLPGLSLIALIFISQSISLDFWVEHRLGTLRRNPAATSDVAGLLAGKVAAGSLLLFAVFVLFLAIAQTVLDVQVGGWPLLVLFGASAAPAILCGMLFLAAAARSESAATVLMSFVSMPLLLLSGAFFPTESLSPTLQRAAALTPTGWMRDRLKSIMLGEADLVSVVGWALLLLGIAALLLLIDTRLLRRRFAAAA